MTFTITVPVTGQSPGAFPAQAHTNWQRIRENIQGDHEFNNTSAVTEGKHKKVTFINQASAPAISGGNSIMWGKVSAFDGVNEVWFNNGTVTQQLNWRERTGTVTFLSAATLTVISGIPTNSYGDIYLFKDTTIQKGTFVSDGTEVKGYSLEMFTTVNNVTPISLNNAGGSLDLGGRTTAPFLGDWRYKIFYRKYV